MISNFLLYRAQSRYHISLADSSLALAMIQYPSTIAEIKQCMFPRRQDGIDCLQVYHAKLTPPKKLKKVKENLGTRVTYCCVDVDCPVRISLKELSYS